MSLPRPRPVVKDRILLTGGKDGADKGVLELLQDLGGNAEVFVTNLSHSHYLEDACKHLLLPFTRLDFTPRMQAVTHPRELGVALANLVKGRVDQVHNFGGFDPAGPLSHAFAELHQNGTTVYHHAWMPEHDPDRVVDVGVASGTGATSPA